MKRAVVVLDGPEKNDVIRKDLGAGDLIVAVDRGLEVCFALDRAPARAFVSPRSVAEKAMDWAHFLGTPCDAVPVSGVDGAFEQALEWALTSEGIGTVDIVNALGRNPVADHARLTVVLRYHDVGVPLAVLTATHRLTVLTGGYTLNGVVGHEFSLVPVGSVPGSIVVKNGKAESHYEGLAAGSTVLLAQRLADRTANLQVTQGAFLFMRPR